MDWQPIETAPRDGTPVLLVDYSLGDPGDPPGFDVFVGYWSDDAHNRGWTCAYYNVRTHDPDHWMPLPAPPVYEEPA